MARQENWPVPLSTLISPEGMHHHDSVHVEGRLIGFDSFAVNLVAGPEMDHVNPVALHFNPRPNENAIVMNHFAGGWANEERVPNIFAPGAEFRLTIKAEHDHFKIKVNDSHIHDFYFRLPHSEARYLVITGGVEVHRSWVEGRMVKEYIMHEHHFHPGHRIYICGVPAGHHQRFAVNIYEHHHHHDNIAFHFSPRFDEGVVVLNALSEGSWGPEQRTTNPFHHDHLFDLVIHVTHEGFQVFVNGFFFTSFAHRLSHHHLKAIELKDFHIHNFLVVG